MTEAERWQPLVGRSAEIFRHLDRPLLVDVIDPYERAGRDQRSADRRADAIAAAGHERAPTFAADLERHEAQRAYDDLRLLNDPAALAATMFANVAPTLHSLATP